MRRVSVISAFVLLNTVIVARVHAGPVTIAVLHAEYTATAGINDPGFAFLEDSGPGYASVSYNCTDPDGSPCGYADASATAQPFRVTASMNAGYYSMSAWASAETDLTFSPLADGTAMLGLAFEASSWSPGGADGVARLFDVTEDQQLWEYSWLSQPAEGVPTALSAAHAYRLHLGVASEGSMQGYSMIEVSGLQEAVPDPGSTLLLLGMGLMGLMAGRKRWQ